MQKASLQPQTNNTNKDKCEMAHSGGDLCPRVDYKWLLMMISKVLSTKGLQKKKNIILILERLSQRNERMTSLSTGV